MITTNRTAQAEHGTIIKTHPVFVRMRRLRKWMVASLICTFLGMLIIVGSFLTAHLTGSPIVILPLSFVSFALLCISLPLNIANTLRMERFWKRLDQRRMSAAQGDQSLLAQEQPAPNAQALQLPLTIGQSPNWVGMLIFPAVMLMTILIGSVAFLVFLPQLSVVPHHKPIPATIMYIALAIAIVYILIMCGVLVGIMYYRTRYLLTVTETGLIKPGFRKVQSIAWSQARLFAIDGIYGAKKYQFPSVFELASENDTITWTWLRANSRRVIFFAQPKLSREAYEQQMTALLSLIAARTGLPLYDLREPGAKNEVVAPAS